MDRRSGARVALSCNETPIGFVPRLADLDLRGLEISNDQIGELMAVRGEEWLPELDLQEQFFAGIGETLPLELDVQREALRAGVEQT